MIVIDASAVVNLIFSSDPDTRLASLAREVDVHAPALLDFEVASGLRGVLRSGKISPEAVAAALDKFVALNLERHSMTGSLPAILALAHNFTAYDAAYVTLARALHAPLYTADIKLLEARRLGVDVRLVAAA